MSMLDAILGYRTVLASLVAGTGITITDLGATLKQIRIDAAAAVGTAETYHKTLTGELTTDDATPVDILTYTVPDNVRGVVIVTAVAIDATANTGNVEYYVHKYTIERDAGIITLAGPVTVVADVTDDAAVTVLLVGDEAGDATNVLRVQATGAATDITTFSVRVVIDLAPAAAV